MGIQIQVTYLSNTYHGKVYPPAPGTLFQALIEGNYRVDREGSRVSLLALENYGAPKILCPPISTPSIVTLHPRDNVEAFDSKVLYGSRKTRAANCNIEHTKRVFEGAATIVYYWDVNPSDEEFQQLEVLVNRLYRLGRGEDAAFAKLIRAESPTRPEGWTELEATDQLTNLVLSSPVPGSLESLEDKFDNELDSKAGSHCPGVNYKRSGEVITRYAAFLLKDDNAKMLNHPWHRMIDVAAWFRHAAGKAMDGKLSPDSFSGFIMGHHTNKAMMNQRLIVAPLPTVGPHTDGGIRRVLLAEPRHIQPPFKGVLQSLADKLRGSIKRLDTQAGSVEATPVTLQEDSVLRKYVSSGVSWTTTTPMVLHGHSSNHGKLNRDKTNRMIMEAFQQAGISSDQILETSFHAAPMVHGPSSAKQVEVPDNLRGYPRYHVSVRFREKLQGPIFAGMGRHRGLGTFVCVD